jgi:hypothetical protein
MSCKRRREVRRHLCVSIDDNDRIVLREIELIQCPTDGPGLPAFGLILANQDVYPSGSGDLGRAIGTIVRDYHDVPAVRGIFLCRQGVQTGPEEGLFVMGRHQEEQAGTGFLVSGSQGGTPNPEYPKKAPDFGNRCEEQETRQQTQCNGQDDHRIPGSPA